MQQTSPGTRQLHSALPRGRSAAAALAAVRRHRHTLSRTLSPTSEAWRASSAHDGSPIANPACRDSSVSHHLACRCRRSRLQLRWVAEEQSRLLDRLFHACTIGMGHLLASGTPVPAGRHLSAPTETSLTSTAPTSPARSGCRATLRKYRLPLYVQVCRGCLYGKKNFADSRIAPRRTYT